MMGATPSVPTLNNWVGDVTGAFLSEKQNETARNRSGPLPAGRKRCVMFMVENKCFAFFRFPVTICGREAKVTIKRFRLDESDRDFDITDPKNCHRKVMELNVEESRRVEVRC